MSSIPLHPMVVHMPLALLGILPIAALVALWAIWRGVTPARAWAVPLAFAAALAGSAFVATRTGEAEEERVEEVVPERAIHEHEEAAERFLVLSAVLALLAAAGLARGRVGQASRYVSTFGAFGLIAAGVQVGKAGGELVYRDGAASAYTSSMTAIETSDDNDHNDDEEADR